MIIDNSWYTKPEGVHDRYGAGGIVVRKSAALLYIALIKEGLESTFYALPKGGVEKNEDKEEAARREIQEEAGFTDLQVIMYLGTCERLNFEKNRWSITSYFLFTTQEEQSSVVDGEFVTEWFDLDHLPPLFWPEQQKLIEDNRDAIKKILA